MLGFLRKFFQPDSDNEGIWRLDRCFACHKVLREGMVFPEDQVSFCIKCFHSTLCYCCGLPCGPVHRRLTDDRIICQYCYDTALLTPRQLAPVYETTLRFFRRQLKLKLKEQPRLKVVDSRFMQSELGVSLYTWGVYSDIGSEETIYMLTGIALDKAHATFAHELTHFWQKRHCPPEQTLELIEGFAEWVAFQLAKHQNLRRAMLAIRRNEAEPYRTGLQKMFQLEAKRGIKGAIKYARTAKSF